VKPAAVLDAAAERRAERPGAASLRRHLWKVAVATFLVAVCPMLLVWRLRAAGVIASAPVGMVVAMAVSLTASYLGSAFWETRDGSGDLLFGELMVWGFVRRWRAERRLASALRLLGSMTKAQRRVSGGLSAESQASALEKLGAALEATDPHTHGHSRRVARHSWMIARQLGLSREQVARIRTAAAVHDVGKIETPPAILRKPGALTDEEFDVIKRHPVDGAGMADVLGDPELTAIVRHHHERLDGTGYPCGMSGEEIPLGARIIAVADTFDAITSARPYRPARPHKQAIDILKYEAGVKLDPVVVRAFCGLYSGRRPFLALWASLTSLPGQGLSWLGNGVVGVASAAQVAAVTAAVGVAAIAHPVPSRHPIQTATRGGAIDTRYARFAQTTPTTPALPARARPRPRSHHATRAPGASAVLRSSGVATRGGSSPAASPTSSSPPSGAGERSVPGPTAAAKGNASAPTEGADGKGSTPAEGSHGPTPSAGGKGEAPSTGEGGKGKGPTPGEGGKGSNQEEAAKGKGPTPSEGGKGKAPTPSEGGKGKGPTPAEGGKGSSSGEHGKGPTPPEAGRGEGHSSP
jgi:HD-GYP domain-containing protein (c-di-GMP phosphodiesterase class II)